MNSLEQALLEWDGKSSAEITRIYEQFSAESDFISRVIKLIPEADMQESATWLIKRKVDEGGTFTLRQANSIYRRLPTLLTWQAKLHVLQSMIALPIRPHMADDVEGFLRDCLLEKNKFVRAWAYNGLYLLARQYPVYQSEVKLLLAQAQDKEAASVRARIRNIMKQGF